MKNVKMVVISLVTSDVVEHFYATNLFMTGDLCHDQIKNHTREKIWDNIKTPIHLEFEEQYK